MNDSENYECVVLNCTNTSDNQSGKLFIRVPSEKYKRIAWLDFAGIDQRGIAVKTKLYICEDHFDIKNDMINYMEYKIMGTVKAIRMKPNCIPTKLDPRLTSPVYSTSASLIYKDDSTEEWLKPVYQLEDELTTAASTAGGKLEQMVTPRMKKKADGIRNYNVEIQPFDSEEDLDLYIIKEEEEIINKTIQNFYKDRDAEDSMYIGPGMFQENANEPEQEYKYIHVVNDGTEVDDKASIEETVKSEKDEEVKTFNKCEIKQEVGLKWEFTNNYDTVIKKEKNELFDINVKCIKQEKGDENNKCLENYENDNDGLCEDYIIKKELLVDTKCIQIDNDDEIKNEGSDELYENHIVKDELVVGPECVQAPSPSLANKNIQPHFFNKSFKIIEHKYVCEYCQRSFDNRMAIKQHLWRHEHAELSCHVCGKQFSYANNLTRHMSVHSGRKPFNCEKCDKKFARKDYLNLHKYLHHSDTSVKNIRTPSTCELCNKEFSRTFARNHHKKYACPMNVNKLKANKDKVYACDVCNKIYPYRTSLALHILRCHTTKKTGTLHQCDHCGKKYVKKHNLQCHMQSKHLNINPYKCTICDSTFSWYSTLAAHEKKMHLLNEKS